MILAVDFGGTRSRVGWYDADLNQLARAEAPSLTHESPSAVIDRLIALARSVVPPGTVPAAVGLSAPGPQAYTGVILHANTLPGWDRVPLADRMASALGAPVYTENDANLAALAEYHVGAGQGADPMLYLTISTGIGGGAVIGGKLFTGWRGLAIEPGHLKFPAPDGRVYSLEALASGTALGRRARERLSAETTPSILRDRPLDRVDGQVVGEAAAAGDPLANEVAAEAGRWLGLGLVALTHLFNPQTIVMGGSVTRLGDLLLTPARAALAELLIDPVFNAPDLVRLSTLGDDGPLLGAAQYARARHAALPGDGTA